MTKQARDLDAGARLRVRQLRGQALSALGALLDGLQGADGTAQHRLLEGDERHVYAGLVATILRIVVVLFAEARGLMPAGGPRSLRELHADLVAGRAAPGAWARMLALFQHLHAAASAGASPHGRRGGLFEDHHARRGGLFDPETYPFLDARTSDPGEAPRVPDAAVLEVLDRLLFVAREPLSYEDLDVEHIGVVHEWLTAFRLERAGSSGGGGDGPGGSRLVLQAGEERRRLGAHYTSRALTRIIVEKTLEPLIRDRPSPDEILALKVCDPAMGSGAFLLEACRQLACRLASAWQETSSAPPPSDAGDRTLHARRLVAQRCLYGVDRNPVAVDLARLSLWLLAKDRDLPFTFVDHALRHGDSLVGLTREQIAGITPGAGGIAQAGEPRTLQHRTLQHRTLQHRAPQHSTPQRSRASGGPSTRRWLPSSPTRTGRLAGARSALSRCSRAGRS